MENGPFIDDFPIKTSVYKGFSMAMLNNQRVSSALRLSPTTIIGLWLRVRCLAKWGFIPDMG